MKVYRIYWKISPSLGFLALLSHLSPLCLPHPHSLLSSLSPSHPPHFPLLIALFRPNVGHLLYSDRMPRRPHRAHGLRPPATLCGFRCLGYKQSICPSSQRSTFCLTVANVLALDKARFLRVNNMVLALSNAGLARSHGIDTIIKQS